MIEENDDKYSMDRKINLSNKEKPKNLFFVPEDETRLNKA
jgi:hypothetical protein